MILPGAVAKGAYEAGAIDALAQKEIKIDRIVATSSGALNGVALAAGIRSGRTKEMATLLVKTWIEGGGWHNSLNLSPWNWIRGRGLSDSAGLMKMLNDLVKPQSLENSPKNDVEIRIIVAPLNGIPGKIGKTPATTHEKVIHFSGKDFDTAEGLARIFHVTIAACAFPGLFAPVEVDGLGPCLDGGAVNNAPIGYALSECDVNQIFMPIPFPLVQEGDAPTSGFGMFNHMIEILINERLYRDLKSSIQINDDILKLEKLVSDGVITSVQLDAIKKVIEIRKVEINQIRPSHSLGENAFSGFFSKRDRTLMVEAGRKATLDVLNREKTLSL